MIACNIIVDSENPSDMLLDMLNIIIPQTRAVLRE